MSAIHDLAERHCAHLPQKDRDMFMLGFNAGRSAGHMAAGSKLGLSPDDDRESYFRSLIAQDDWAAAAGFLHGLAATRPATSPTRCERSCSHSLCHTVRKEQARRDGNRLKAGVS